MYFRSVQLNGGAVAYLIARFCSWDRTYFVPLVLDRDEPNLDQRVRSHIEYSAVFNPRGSGAYTHWGQYHIRYYIACSFRRQ